MPYHTKGLPHEGAAPRSQPPSWMSSWRIGRLRPMHQTRTRPQASFRAFHVTHAACRIGTLHCAMNQGRVRRGPFTRRPARATSPGAPGGNVSCALKKLTRVPVFEGAGSSITIWGRSAHGTESTRVSILGISLGGSHDPRP